MEKTASSSKYLKLHLLENDPDNNKEYVPQKKLRTDESDEEEDESCLNTNDLKELDALSEEFLNRVVIHSLITQDACTHDVAIPPGYKYYQLEPMSGKPMKEYKFTLDPFQKESILCIHNNQSVLVSAHTSAGKTVVAEYAIATSLANKQRVIYTTPIKALSNQKYREFYNEFQDVGLITGDVTINPEASCLIMTTEILRNMLYRGSEIIRQVGWVIFDEIHYMRNLERGVVWEESLILLPNNVHYVFLSATIPNARQFAEWVCHLHKQPCHVVYSDYRPTPLQHFLFPSGAQGIYMIIDEHGVFKEDSFKLAMDSLLAAGDAAKGDQFGRQGGMQNNPTETNIFKIVKLGVEHKFAPMICFSFSKKECEVYAMQMAKLDFNDENEKKLIEEVFNNAIEILSEDDKKLPAVNNLLPLLRRGIGIHHGGLLPILKEIVEILFGEGLLKILFATETFAMGLNMPARTVIFSGIRKYDGKNLRSITSGEYIQMSGRAGRRGLDSKGIVILMMDDKVLPKDCRNLLQGDADPINSAFHLTYNMILNLLRVEEINPEYMLERSFYQFQNQAKLPYLLADYRKKLMDAKRFRFENEADIEAYYNIRQSLNSIQNRYLSYITQPKYVIPFLSPGRMIKVKLNEIEQDWGVVVNFRSQNSGKKNIEENVRLAVHVLLKIDTGVESENTDDIEVVQIEQQNILRISAVRLNLPRDLTQKNNKLIIMKTIQEAKIRMNDNIPLLDPVKDMGISDKNFLKLVENIKYFEKKLMDHKLHSDPKLDEIYNKYDRKIQAQKQLDKSRQDLMEAKSLLQLQELKNRKRLLRRLNFCSISDVIELKGRIACELTSGDELLMTELMFNGFFNTLSAAQCAALLSTLVCDEKTIEPPVLSNELKRHFTTFGKIAKNIARCIKESGLPIDEEEYVSSFKPYLVNVTYAWATGVNFHDLCKMTDIFEGSIIRCMRRLEELLRQMVQAAKGIGSSELEEKFSEAIKLIKRDIIFASSLYL